MLAFRFLAWEAQSLNKMIEQKIEKWEKELARILKGIEQAQQYESIAMIELLYPKMEQVTEFIKDLKECVGK